METEESICESIELFSTAFEPLFAVGSYPEIFPKMSDGKKIVIIVTPNSFAVITCSMTSISDHSLDDVSLCNHDSSHRTEWLVVLS